MSQSPENPVERAEKVLKRLFERLGAIIDDKLSGPVTRGLSSTEVSGLIGRLEQTVESSLREDDGGLKCLAPNVFEVLITYERSAGLSEQYLEALGIELKRDIFEYINNHRYKTIGPVCIRCGFDLFTKAPIIKPLFKEDITAESGDFTVTEESDIATSRSIELRSEDGRIFRMDLLQDSGPLYIGRAAGCAIKLDEAGVSRLHCSLSLNKEGDIIVSDLGSSNGTSINGRLLSKGGAEMIEAGDVLTIGDISLELEESR